MHRVAAVNIFVDTGFVHVYGGFEEIIVSERDFPEAAVVAVVYEGKHDATGVGWHFIARNIGIQPLGPVFEDQPAGRIRVEIKMKIFTEGVFEDVVVTAGENIQNQVAVVAFRIFLLAAPAQVDPAVFNE